MECPGVNFRVPGVGCRVFHSEHQLPLAAFLPPHNCELGVGIAIGIGHVISLPQVPSCMIRQKAMAGRTGKPFQNDEVRKVFQLPSALRILLLFTGMSIQPSYSAVPGTGTTASNPTSPSLYSSGPRSMSEFSISSQVISRPVYAASRPIMAARVEVAVSVALL